MLDAPSIKELMIKTIGFRKAQIALAIYQAYHSAM
jgi:hypothetical protein